MGDTTIGIERRLDLPYEQAVERTREALAAEGFGMLTEIDVQRTLKEKINADFRSYVILGSFSVRAIRPSPTGRSAQSRMSASFSPAT